LKIDASFIRNIKNAGDDDVITRTVIAMAQNLNLEVLAEGVETEDQMNFLKENKCGEVQGFYYSKPLSMIEFGKLLEDGVEKHKETI
jgi:EAL domain-containing protein (putative c-di-GMP-specific phosphodiesterase class I)